MSAKTVTKICEKCGIKLTGVHPNTKYCAKCKREVVLKQKRANNKKRYYNGSKGHYIDKTCLECKKIMHNVYCNRKYYDKCIVELNEKWGHASRQRQRAKKQAEKPEKYCVICGTQLLNKTGGKIYCNYCTIERQNGTNLHNLHPSKERALDRADALRRFKQKMGCARCGNKDIRVLQFHHIHPEDKECAILGKYKRSKLLCEILKCEVLYSNYHVIAHYEMEDIQYGWHKPKRYIRK